VCPEVECGLPIPREAMRLVGDPDAPRLVTVKSGIDHTEKMKAWAERKLDELENYGLCGFVFKSKSPSSGMERIKVYNEAGIPARNGRGIFAAMFMERFPFIPVEDEGRLNDPDLRQQFIERVFVMKRWRDLLARGASRSHLIDFHTRHKLLLRAHDVRTYEEMGRLLGNAGDYEDGELVDAYFDHLTRAMKSFAGRKKHTSVLEHMLGYFKRHLTSDEKQEMLEVISSYKEGNVPLIVPITLFQHYVRKYDEPYLANQVYLKPHPLELQLRNNI
jgi:uncharacterized protein YbgA (DUF1722 family)/uncharacterized protein YbbK (DUF523 family)